MVLLPEVEVQLFQGDEAVTRIKDVVRAGCIDNHLVDAGVAIHIQLISSIGLRSFPDQYISALRVQTQNPIGN